MSKQRQTNVCLCNSSLRKQCLALFSDHDLKDIRVNTNQFKEKFAKRLFGITEVNHIILHPIQLRSISVPLCLFSCSKQVHTPQLTCSLTHTQTLGKQTMPSLSPLQARLLFPIPLQHRPKHSLAVCKIQLFTLPSPVLS